MTARARLLAGAAVGLAGAVASVAAAGSVWRTVTPSESARVVTVDGKPVRVGDGGPVPLKGTSQDAGIVLFALAGGAAALVAPLLSQKPRLGAAAFTAAAGLMVVASAAIARSRVLIPDTLAPDAAGYRAWNLGPPTAAPLVAVAGGAVMVAAAAWLVAAARNVPRLAMPEGPPEAAAEAMREGRDDDGAWE